MSTILVFCFYTILFNYMLASDTKKDVKKVFDCGMSNTPIAFSYMVASRFGGRVVGGLESPVNAWPWMAALWNVDGNVKVFCGGVVINPKYVLTAAHCVIDRIVKEPNSRHNFKVRLGEMDVCTDKDGANPIDFDVLKIIPHENFKSKSIENDIALLHLQTPIRFSKSVQPICIPTDNMKSETFDNAQPFVAGWGGLAYGASTSSVLRHVKLKCINTEVCAIMFSPIRMKITSNQICAGFKLGGKDACQGDSGGPLMLHLNNKWYAIGVVSTGYKCAEPNFPGVYTRVTSYIDWINDHL